MSALAAVADPRMFDPVRFSDLLEEVGAKNHVRVVKFEARRKPFGPTVHKKVMDEMGESVACVPALVMQDSLRMLAGKKPIFLPEVLRRIGGELRSITPNTRTNVGTDFAAAQLSGTSVAVADYIGLSNNTVAIAAADTSNVLPWNTAQAADAAASATTGEYTAIGMARKQATYAHTASAANYTMAATWTATGAVTALQKAGLFGGAAKTAQGNGATNILVLANTFTATSMVLNDQLSLTWTVNI